MAGLRVHSAHVEGYRNHKELVTEFNPDLTVLVGKNAAGKTNVLEAIMVTATGSSFRSFLWEDLVKEGAKRARVRLQAQRDDSPVEVSLLVEKGGKRSFSVNGRTRKLLADVVGRVPVVAFVPEDLLMSKGPSEARRGPIDALGDRLSPAYSAIRTEYARLVRQRNSLLKQGATGDHLEAWNEMVAEVGASLALYRARLLSRMDEPAIEAYKEVSGGERLRIAYKASWQTEKRDSKEVASLGKQAVKEAILGGFREQAEREKDRGMTLVGPHRDDIALMVEERPVRAFASQGQHRTVALAWKMAEVAAVEQVTGVRPLLLLDDVMSEFDEDRREALSSYVMQGPQTIVTTTNLSYFSPHLLQGASVVRIGDE